jgi:hypothetical protein
MCHNEHIDVGEYLKNINPPNNEGKEIQEENVTSFKNQKQGKNFDKKNDMQKYENFSPSKDFHATSSPPSPDISASYPTQPVVIPTSAKNVAFSPSPSVSAFSSKNTSVPFSTSPITSRFPQIHSAYSPISRNFLSDSYTSHDVPTFLNDKSPSMSGNESKLPWLEFLSIKQRFGEECLTILNDNQFVVAIQHTDIGHMAWNIESVSLKFEMPSGYPFQIPKISITNKNLPEELRDSAAEKVTIHASQYKGNTMIDVICAWVQDNLDSLIVNKKTLTQTPNDNNHKQDKER